MKHNIIDQFQQIPTTCISDAMQGMNNLDPRIKPLTEEYRIAGRALTVQMPVGDNMAVLRAIREAKPGDILVVDAKGDEYRAIAGDFVVGMAQSLGIKGIIVDGTIRDILGIKKLHFPVFSRGTTAAASGKAGGGEINVPISCGGAPVHPGDIVVGDADGVVVVPQALEQEVLRNALAKLDKDNMRAAQYSGNPEKIILYLDEIIGTAQS
ncbi:RraA family protein [Paenibacillus radicis (ex Xue et al. 2023)]|uniref:Putative 4-hydroxy-4-methyl-2-oxoglutarate aldolase n=1 Tax=Paenibacillus radicis (ex Xue et al. 2023) TaxID=2972489 RepID=A0ABT1YQU4_9BACL|nr:RraA family protein [Paenibacillus radicis (ex Xue et al. 2023)]MCR8635536.1 RraA family protein [Paenibacillus radicis (ex Xue et al. 2023)]